MDTVGKAKPMIPGMLNKEATALQLKNLQDSLGKWILDNYLDLDIDISNTPVGQLIFKWDIPIITAYINIDVKFMGISLGKYYIEV